MNTCKRLSRTIIYLAFGSNIILFLFNGCSSTRELADTQKPNVFRPLEVLENQEGLASYYHNKFHRRVTANGERYDKRLYTAAHRTYPFGTVLRVTRVETGKVVLVRVNDRGPFRMNRLIDLSYAAAKELSMLRAGVISVKIEVLSWGNEDNTNDDEAKSKFVSH